MQEEQEWRQGPPPLQFSGAAEWMPAEICVFGRQVKAQLLERMNAEVERIRKHSGREGIEQLRYDDDVLQYFVEMLRVPRHLTHVFKGRLKFVQICQPQFDFKEFFAADKNQFVKQTIMEQITDLIYGRAPKKPCSIMVLEVYSERFLAMPEGLVQRLKGLQQGRRPSSSVTNIQTAQEAQMIRLVVVKCLEEKLKAGRQNRSDLLKVFEDANTPFREKLETFMTAERNMRESVDLSFLIQKIREQGAHKSPNNQRTRKVPESTSVPMVVPNADHYYNTKTYGNQNIRQPEVVINGINLGARRGRTSDKASTKQRQKEEGARPPSSAKPQTGQQLQQWGVLDTGAKKKSGQQPVGQPPPKPNDSSARRQTPKGINIMSKK